MARKTKKSAGAIDAYKGFAAQPTRMALLLLKAGRGAKVSLEYLDDVGVHNADGTQLASQMKVGRTNPVSDRAVPLWKTFANWVRQVRFDGLDPSSTTFELHVPKKFSGAMVRRFSDAKTKVSVRDAFLEARRLHWGEFPNYSKRSEVAATLQPHLEELFGSDAGSRAFQAVIARFQFTIAGKTAVQELHDHIVDVVGVLPSAVEKVLCYYHGWITKTVQEQVDRTHKPPVIAREDAFNEFHSFYRSIAMGGALPDLATEPTPEDYANLLKFQFIRQLELINADAKTRDFAMTMFFKAGSVRTKWVDHDHIREDSIEKLYQTLMQAHRDYQALGATSASSAEIQGRALLAQCQLHRCQLEQKEPPDYFVPGCFHTLADTLQLGWHPNYLKLLQSVA